MQRSLAPLEVGSPLAALSGEANLAGLRNQWPRIVEEREQRCPHGYGVYQWLAAFAGGHIAKMLPITKSNRAGHGGRLYGT